MKSPNGVRSTAVGQARIVEVEKASTVLLTFLLMYDIITIDCGKVPQVVHSKFGRIALFLKSIF